MPTIANKENVGDSSFQRGGTTWRTMDTAWSDSDRGGRRAQNINKNATIAVVSVSINQSAVSGDYFQLSSPASSALRSSYHGAPTNHQPLFVGYVSSIDF